MPKVQANGVGLYYELHGSGEPLVLVHGSWVDATVFAAVVPRLCESFRVLVYDRRGHSRSERPDAQGSVDEDGDDLAALLEALDLAPAYVATNSLGGNIALRLALRRPELFRFICCHEPPLLGLLENDPEGQAMLQQTVRTVEVISRRIAEGDHEGGAHQFVDEIAFAPGAWENELPPEAREMCLRNATTWLDELRDPNLLRIDEDALARLEVPVCLTQGSDSSPLFLRTLDLLFELIPRATRETIEGAAHVAQQQAPERYVEVTTRAMRQAASSH
jgi:pimeloyl-ACP methyl ester carboxylesterase